MLSLRPAFRLFPCIYLDYIDTLPVAIIGIETFDVLYCIKPFDG